MAESISEGALKMWQKKAGDAVAARDEVATSRPTCPSTRRRQQDHEVDTVTVRKDLRAGQGRRILCFGHNIARGYAGGREE
jgi:hypothetical protein